MGGTDLKALRKAGNAKYTSERIIQEMLDVLSNTVQEEILEEVHASSMISILCDESTDIAVTKQLVVYIRYIKNGKACTRFLKIKGLADGKAVTIEKALIEICTKANISVEKIAAFGSDGASVMVGRHEGVAARLKGHVSHIISIHCAAHRLALATAHASEAVTYIKKYSTMLKTIYAFYHRSPVRTASLHEIQQVLGDPSIKFKEPKHVRWLSHGRAIIAIRTSLPSLIASLEKEAVNEPTAAGLVKAVTTYEFVACTYLLSDILTSLNNLSLTFQKRDIDMSIVQPRVESTIFFLTSLKSVDGPIMKRLPQAIDEGLAIYNLHPTLEKIEKFKRTVIRPYIDSLVDNLKDRFPHIGLLDAFQLFNPAILPVPESEELLDHGFMQLQTLLDHYSPSLVDAIKANEEWSNFLPDMIRLFTKKTYYSVLSSLTSNTVLIATYPELSKLAAAALVVPMSTADCERGFSAMNRIKTDLRNSLKTETLDQLMRISIEGKEREYFNFNRAADMWASKGNRRLHV